MNLTDIKDLPKFDHLRISHYKDLTSASDIHLVNTIILTLLHDHKQAKSKKDIVNLTRLSTEEIDRGIKLLFRNSKTDNRREGLPFIEKDGRYSILAPLSSLIWKSPESSSSSDKNMAKAITDKIKHRVQKEKEMEEKVDLDYGGESLDDIFADDDDKENTDPR